MKTPYVLVGLICLTLFGYSHQGYTQPIEGQYLRKSVSSIRDILVKPNQLPRKGDADTEFMSRIMKNAIEVSRFDFNNLPEAVVSDFAKEINHLDTLSISAIGDVVERTVAKKVREILTDPDVMKARIAGFKTEADLATFAATKAKELTLSEHDLELLLNSAYFYLPYITQIKTDISDKKNITVTIKGAILWYQIRESASGVVEVVLVKNAKVTDSMGFASIDDASNRRFIFNGESIKTDAYNYALYDAVQVFAQNAAVVTKEISDFKLKAQIMEVSLNAVAFNLGTKEGVQLDDGFYIKRASENAKGDVVYKDVAYVRVSKRADNEKDPIALSYAKKLIVGRSPEIGDVVFENPRLGLDLKFSGGYEGVKIPFAAIIDEKPDLGSSLNNDVTGEFVGTYTIGMDLSYNLAPSTGVSQSFFDLTMNAGVPMTESETETVPLYASGYLGYTRKFGFRRLSFTFGLSAGVNYFLYSESDKTDSDSDEEDPLKYQFITGGLRGTAGIELLLTPNLSMYGKAGYTGAFTMEDKPNLGGTYFSFGFSYSLRQLGVNPFSVIEQQVKK